MRRQIWWSVPPLSSQETRPRSGAEQVVINCLFEIIITNYPGCHYAWRSITDRIFKTIPDNVGHTPLHSSHIFISAWSWSVTTSSLPCPGVDHHQVLTLQPAIKQSEFYNLNICLMFHSALSPGQDAKYKKGPSDVRNDQISTSFSKVIQLQ